MITASGRELRAAIDVQALRWQDDAACSETGTEPFFAEGDGRFLIAARALATCAACPVREPCLEYALEYEARPETAGHHGIFGGTIPAEREAIARVRKQEAA
jgi:WhiB family transcriptional regulator, redox-sensing transcriptional regulator